MREGEASLCLLDSDLTGSGQIAAWPTHLIVPCTFSLSLSLLWPLLLFGLHIPLIKATVNADHIIKLSFRLCFSWTGKIDFARTESAHVSV